VKALRGLEPDCGQCVPEIMPENLEALELYMQAGQDCDGAMLSALLKGLAPADETECLIKYLRLRRKVAAAFMELSGAG
jgi:hypothetical protein